MIIGCDLIVQLFLSADFKPQVLQCYGMIVPMKDPSNMLEKSDLTSREMPAVVMQNSEPVSTRESTKILV